MLAAPAGAVATWSPPVTLSGPGINAHEARVAIDPSGNAVFVWLSQEGTTNCPQYYYWQTGCSVLKARTRSASGALSAVQTLSAPGYDSGSPDVAIDRNGNAVFVWARDDGTTNCGGYACAVIETRVRSATGALSATQALSGPDQAGLSYSHVAVDRDGRAVYVWWRYFAGTIQGRVRAPDGTLSPSRLVLSDPGEYHGQASDPEVAVDQAGDAMFVWDRLDSQGYPSIQTRALSPSGTLSSIQTLSGPGDAALSYAGPDIGIDEGGNAVFAWARWDHTGPCDPGGYGCTRIVTQARSASGALSASQTLSAAGQSAASQQVAVDPAGDAAYVWDRPDGAANCGAMGCFRVQARTRTASGVLSPTQTLSIGGQHAFYPDVGIDQGANADFVWIRVDGTTCFDMINGGMRGCQRIQARSRYADGSLSPIQTLSGPGQSAWEPQVGVNPSGNAVAVWWRFDGTHPDPETPCCLRIQAATGP
jgi:hypothetical protein